MSLLHFEHFWRDSFNKERQFFIFHPISPTLLVLLSAFSEGEIIRICGYRYIWRRHRQPSRMLSMLWRFGQSLFHNTKPLAWRNGPAYSAVSAGIFAFGWSHFSCAFCDSLPVSFLTVLKQISRYHPCITVVLFVKCMCVFMTYLLWTVNK